MIRGVYDCLTMAFRGKGDKNNKEFKNDSLLTKDWELLSSEMNGIDDKVAENTIRRGILKDRLVFMSVVISTNLVHNLYVLDVIINIVEIFIKEGPIGKYKDSLLIMITM